MAQRPARCVPKVLSATRSACLELAVNAARDSTVPLDLIPVTPKAKLVPSTITALAVLNSRRYVQWGDTLWEVSE